MKHLLILIALVSISGCSQKQAESPVTVVPTESNESRLAKICAERGHVWTGIDPEWMRINRLPVFYPRRIVDDKDTSRIVWYTYPKREGYVCERCAAMKFSEGIRHTKIIWVRPDSAEIRIFIRFGSGATSTWKPILGEEK